MKSDGLFKKGQSRHIVRSAAGDALVYNIEAYGSLEGTAFSILDLSIDCPETNSKAYAFETSEDVLSWCAAAAMQSPAARALLLHAGNLGWSVAFSDVSAGGFSLDVSSKLLALDHHAMQPEAIGQSPFFCNSIFISFVKGLREIWHESRNGEGHLPYRPEDILALERVRHADTDTVTILIGWELRGAGHAAIWRHILGSEEGDMAMIFSRCLEKDPKSLFSGKALAKTFWHWYSDDDRVNAADHHALEGLDELLRDSSSKAILGQNRVKAKAVEAFSELPDGTYYLKACGDNILQDPHCAGLTEPVNQAHLFQIVYDLEVIMAGNVPFRDGKLARKIFPGHAVTRV